MHGQQSGDVMLVAAQQRGQGETGGTEKALAHEMVQSWLQLAERRSVSIAGRHHTVGSLKAAPGAEAAAEAGLVPAGIHIALLPEGRIHLRPPERHGAKRLVGGCICRHPDLLLALQSVQGSTPA